MWWAAYRILVPWPGIEPAPPRLKAWSLKPPVDYQANVWIAAVWQQDFRIVPRDFQFRHCERPQRGQCCSQGQWLHHQEAENLLAAQSDTVVPGAGAVPSTFGSQIQPSHPWEAARVIAIIPILQLRDPRPVGAQMTHVNRLTRPRHHESSSWVISAGPSAV